MNFLKETMLVIVVVVFSLSRDAVSQKTVNNISTISSAKTSSDQVQTSIAKQMMMSTGISSSPAIPQSSSEQATPVPAAAATTTSNNDKVTEASMKGMTGTPTTKNNMVIIESLVHSKVPEVRPTTRPTCKNSSSMRRALSPLAIVFIALLF